MGLVQYIKETQAEMSHVAWPTQTQTVVYTALVVLVSIIVSLYVGFFDFLFTQSLGAVVESRFGNTPSAIEISTSTPDSTTDAPALDFDINAEGVEGGSIVPIDINTETGNE